MGSSTESQPRVPSRLDRARYHAIEVPIHAVLVFSFVHFWGIEGAALAWTVRNILDAALLFTASARLTATDPRTRAG